MKKFLVMLALLSMTSVFFAGCLPTSEDADDTANDVVEEDSADVEPVVEEDAAEDAEEEAADDAEEEVAEEEEAA